MGHIYSEEHDVNGILPWESIHTRQMWNEGQDIFTHGQHVLGILKLTRMLWNMYKEMFSNYNGLKYDNLLYINPAHAVCYSFWYCTSHLRYVVRAIALKITSGVWGFKVFIMMVMYCRILIMGGGSCCTAVLYTGIYFNYGRTGRGNENWTNPGRLSNNF